MYSDILSPDYQIISQNKKIMVSARRSELLFLASMGAEDYTPDSLVKKDLIAYTEMPQSGELDNIIKGAFHSGQDTELRHIKAVNETFTYKQWSKLIPFKRGDENVQGDPTNFDKRVINSLIIDYDQRGFYGDVNGNVGYYNNANNLVYDPTPTNIVTLSDFRSLMETLKKEVMLKTFCMESDVGFVLSGQNTRTFLKGTSGAFQSSNQSYLEKDYGAMWQSTPAVQGNWILLDVNVGKEDSISAFCKNNLAVHYTMYPKIFAVGRDEQHHYSYKQYATGSNAINLIEKGSALTQKVTFNPA